MKLQLTLKPSLVASYYEHNCDKYLVYNTISKDVRDSLNWNSVEFSRSAAAEAGVKWEKILLERLEDDDTVELINLKEDDNYKVTLKDTVRVLKELDCKDKPVYIYQACFCETKSFTKQYFSNLKDFQTTCSLSSRMYPDFIKAEYLATEDKYQLTIIDAKNASKLKIGAEIQIALYVKILKAIIKDEGIDNCIVNDVEGVVWNREPITDNKLEHVFKLEDASIELEKFFSEKTVKICELVDSCDDGSVLQTLFDYRIAQQCGYCDNYQMCKDYCIKENNVRLMPYMSISAQDRLCELRESGILEDEKIDTVVKLLGESPRELTDDCSYWKRVKNDIKTYKQGLDSYYDGKKDRYPKEASSISLPIGQNFSLFLTAQQDVNSGRVYAYSWLLNPGKNIDIWDLGFNKYGYVQISEGKDKAPGKGTYYDTVIAASDSEEEFNRIDREFVERIYELLDKISDYEDIRKRKLQCYVMDDYEYENIERTLFNMLDYLDSVEDQDLIEKVMAILFWLQGERLVTDSELEPEKIVESPITILTSEISRLYVLSAGVSYGLRTIASIFSPKFNFDKDSEEFFGVLTNVVDGIHIVRYWDEKDSTKKKKKGERLGFHLRKRLFVESAILGELQKDARENTIYLSAWPAQYEMQRPKYPDYPEIARLDFENRYEELLKYRQIRGVRIHGIDNAIDSGTILSLRYTGRGNTYQIINNETYVGNEWFTAWFCEDTPENRLQIMILKDKDYTSTRMRFAKVIDVRDTDTVFYPRNRDIGYNFEDDGETATVDVAPDPEADFTPIKGSKYLLFEVYSDMNSPKTSKGIERLVDRQDLLDPNSLSGGTGLVYNKAAEKICKKYSSPDGNKFSPSQEKAFKHLFEQKLSILVGPPASGKTDFIARSLITLSNYYREANGKKLRIMVTAMSHSAIENVLLKLDRMLSKSNPGKISLYKVDKFDDMSAFANRSVSLRGNKNLRFEMDSDDSIQIIGITCWAAYNAFFKYGDDAMRAFDLIVMDEASQIRAMDSFLNLICSNNNTRFLLVGDDDQLPPIIGGKYKETEGEKYIHGSVFKMFLTGLGEGHPDIVNLSDNFRMNGILCKYSSQALYGPDYKAFNSIIESQKISVSEKVNDKVIDSLLDSEYPLVFCEFSGIAREQNAVEIELVTALVNALWHTQTNEETGELSSEVGNFWRDCTVPSGKMYEGSCGIISPHHEHINRLKTSISNDLEINRDDIYIGTVDKLQGKERKTVIVSYGVSEAEKIMSESEFIFSSNRFNVSLTRGKAKSIVFLSDAIAESNLSTNILTSNDSNLRKGIDFIHGFSHFMKTEGDGEILIEEEYPNYSGNVTLKIWKKKLV